MKKTIFSEKTKITALFTLKKSYLFIIFLVPILLLTYCKKDVNSDTSTTVANYDNSIFSRPDNDFAMFFEMETTTLVRPLNEKDTSRLDVLDRIMAQPYVERLKYSVCYGKDGYKEVVVEYLTPNKPINVPKGAMDTRVKNDFRKVRILNGIADYFDANNKVIKSTTCKQDEKEIDKIAEMISNTQDISDEQFNKALKVLKENNFQFQEHPNNIITMKRTTDNNESVVLVVDKKSRMTVGENRYNAQGEIKSQKLIDVEGDYKNPKINKMYFSSYIKSVKGDVTMKIEQFSTFNNFKIIKKSN